MADRSRVVLRQYTQDALNILEQSVRLYEDGHKSFYRVAAAQLRILVCDTTYKHDRQVDIAIIPILLPDLQLQPFTENKSSTKTMGLKTWLDSPSGLQEGMTIRQLIRRVCDIDGGAHVDVKPLAGLPQGGELRQWIIDTSKYLLPILKKALES
jgi:hypothetical protein